MVPLFHATVPLFVKMQFGMSWLFAVVTFSVLPEASVKLPAKKLALQPIVPLNTALVLPTSEPLSTVKEPLGFTVNGPLSESVWPASESVTVPAPLVPRMSAPTVVAPLSETVTPALVMMAVSVAPGTVLGFQLAAVFQPPLAVLIQLMLAASARKPAVRRNATEMVATGRQIAVNIFIIFWFGYFWIEFQALPGLV